MAYYYTIKTNVQVSIVMAYYYTMMTSVQVSIVMAYYYTMMTSVQGPVLLTFLRHVARISANGIAAFKESCSPIG